MTVCDTLLSHKLRSRVMSWLGLRQYNVWSEYRERQQSVSNAPCTARMDVVPDVNDVHVHVSHVP